MREEIIGDARLILGDCREVLPGLGRVDAIITDPPYGIRADENPVRSSQKHERLAWDRDRPDQEIFDLILAATDHAIIWGGNYFADMLPPSMRWLVWNKDTRNFSLADCELAWTSQDNAARVFDYSRGAANMDGKVHPTQKPLALMKWCLKFVPDAVTIVDPFMGSGTTGVAAVQAGKKFIGIEREPKYIDLALRRIEKAYSQPDFFVAPPIKLTQEALW